MVGTGNGIESRSPSDKLVLAADRHAGEGEYWLNKLSGEWVKSYFPYDYNDKRGDAREYPGDMAAETFRLPAPLFAQVMKLSKGVDIKLHMLLVTGLFILLSKYTGSKDILIGAPILKQEIKGDFVNTVLVFRNDVDHKISFKELLLQVRETIIGANENQNYPVEILIDQLNLPMVEGEFPLFDVVLLLENLHEKSYLQDVQCNMVFSFNRVDECIEGVVEYNSSLYRKSTVERIIRHYMRVLDQVLPDVNMQLSRIGLLSEQERKQVLIDFNQGEVDYPADKTLHRLFEEQAARVPDHIAVIGPVGSVGTRFIASDRITITYNQLNEKSNRLAYHLQAKGVKPGDIVGILLKRSIEMMIGIFGILKAGGAYLPLDPDYPEERIVFMLKDCGARILLSEVSKVSEVSGNIEVIDLNEIGKEVLNFPTHPLTHSPTQLCYVIYTSGTTGRPKGVLVEHRNVVAYLHAFFREFEIKPHDAVIQLTSYAFDAFVEEVFPVLLKGGKIVIPGEPELLDVDLLTRLIGRYCVNIIDCTPLLLNEFNRFEPGSPEGKSLQSLHTIISGGDILKGEYVDNLSNIGQVYNTYGPTETTVCAAYYNYTGGYPGVVPIGKPIANYRVHILDGSNTPLPIGAAGELCISGVGVTRGYLNQPELTAEKFNRSYRSYTSYRSGDLARWLPDGSIEFLGRIDQQVKIRGYRVELEEIERHLLNHNGVKDAVVIAREDKEERMEKYLVAYFVPAGTVTAGADEEKPGVEVADLREYLFARVPIYMLPSYFVQLDSIPLSSNGKLDRRALPLAAVKIEGEYVAPRHAVEIHLVEIWSELLLVEKEKIGINANFFELGGHSLNAMTLVSKIHEKLDAKIPLAIVFDMPTVRELAEYIKNTQREKSVRIEPAEKKEYYVMSSAQKRMYIFQQLDAADTTYNMFQVLTINRKVDRNKLTEVFQRLINRHEILRTSAELINEEPVQRVHEHVPFQVEYYPLENGNREAEEQIVKNFVRPFQLDAVPLMRVGLVKREEEQYVLMVDIHHRVVDAISMGILINDFTALYQEQTLPELPIQYKDFSQWQYRLFRSETIKKQETYWLDRFKGEIPLTNISPDYPRPPRRNIQAGKIDFVVENEWYKGLDKLALQKGATLFMALMAVVNILIAKHTDQEDIIIGLPIEGRHQPELQNVLGMFVNMLALRNFPQPYKTFEMFLAEVRKNLLDAYENQDYQFEELVTKLKIKRDLSRNPLFDFVFVMNNVEPIQPETSAAPVTPEPGQDETMIAPYAYDHSTARFDLTLYMQPTADDLDCALRYSTALFKRETIERVIENLHEILHQVVENPGIKIEDIQISTHLTIVDDFSEEDEVDFNF